MPIRVSGMNSGLDTESIVSAMVSAYSTKKDKYIKAQTKLSWKQDAWKGLNKKISGLYSSISSLRYSSAYALKKTTVSDSTKATVTPTGEAVNGTQSLKINKLAKAAALTGAELDKDVTANTKMSELGYSGGTGTINIKVGGVNKTLDINEDSTVQGVVNAFKQLGVSANFDEKNHRLFLNAAESGEEAGFSITAGDGAGMSALSALGIATSGSVDKNVYKDTAELAELLPDGTIDETATKAKIAAAISSLDAAYKEADRIQVQVNDKGEEVAYLAAREKLMEDPDDEEAIKIRDAYESAHAEAKDIDDADIADKKAEAEAELSTLEGQLKDQKKIISDNKSYDIGDHEKYSDDSEIDKLTDKVYNSILTANDIYSGKTQPEISKGAVFIQGTDAEIELNGATFKSATNTFSVNNLTINVTGVTAKDEELSITTSNDVQGLYDKIKDFLTDYNSVINEMTKLYNAESAGGYEPLTDDEKAAMNDTEIEKWETKIKDSLLRRDSSLNTILSTMTSSMMKTYEINGEKLSLGTFGISTLGFLNAEKNEQYAYHIYGDAEDSSVNDKPDKLMAALNEDPDRVVNFLKELTSGLYKNMDNKMKGTALNSRYSVYNDKEMASEYSSYTKTIKKWEEKIADMEDKYFKQFTAMEKQLAQLQNNSSSVTGLLG